MSAVKTQTITKLLGEDASSESPAFLWQRRASISHPRRRKMAAIGCDPTSESDTEVERIARRSPTLAETTFQRWNTQAHIALDRVHDAVEQVEEFLEHVWDVSAKQFITFSFYCNFVVYQVVSHHHLPEWLQDNEFLVAGHRPQLNSYRACFKSIFRIHTETGNIWTHLLGCLAFICMATYIVTLNSPSMSLADKVVYFTYCVGAIVCLGFSWLFHTLYCHSEPVGKLFSKLDYCGISVMVMASFVPWIYYCFYCDTATKFIYLAMSTSLGLLCILVSLRDEFSIPKFRPVRAGLFVAFGCSGFIPAIHFLYEHGVFHSVYVVPGGWLVLMAVLYLTGAMVYAFRFPECFWPGKFDLWGQSHQIFHCFVVAGAFVNYHGINLIHNNLTSICQCVLSHNNGTAASNADNMDFVAF